MTVSFKTHLAGLLVVLFSPAAVALNVFACEPEWAALARSLGGSAVQVVTLGDQTPAFRPRPGDFAAVRAADLVICSRDARPGSGLLRLLQRSGNRAALPGEPGFFNPRDSIPAGGAAGASATRDPAIHLDPRNIMRVARSLTGRLVVLDPDNAEIYKRGALAFFHRWRAAMSKWEAQARPLRDAAVVLDRPDWQHLSNWLGLRPLGPLQHRVAVPPSLHRLSRLLEQATDQPDAIVIQTAHAPQQASAWLANRASLRIAHLPDSVNPADDEPLITLFYTLIERLSNPQTQ
jgi:zinc/manganese transport system substrate-binding protein